MKQIRSLLLLFTALLGMLISQQVVHAEGMSGPNTGDYVYEDKEYITNGQYDQLEAINDKIDRGANPQQLYVLILGDSDDVDYFARETDADFTSKNMSTTIVEKTGNALYGSNHYYDMLLDQGSDDDDLDITNNYLIMDLKHNKVFLNPSLQASLYLTDLVFWKAKWGISSQLKSDNIDTKVDALFQLANNLEPKLENVADSSKMLKSKDSTDVKNFFGMIGFIAAIIIGLIIIIIIHKINKNKPHHGGGGSELGNSDYDAGFDEGYYMGSNDPFM